MPGRLLLCLLALALLLPAAAPAAPVVGISESNPTMFEDQSFLALRATTTRLLIAYDAVSAAERGDPELERRIAPYLAGAAAQGVQPLVTFQHSSGAWEDCAKRPALRQCHLPTVAEYRGAVRAFLERFPSVTLIAPWNEANHAAQPTARNPRMAAEYTNVVAEECRALARPCTLVVADVLDQADRAAAPRPTFRATTRWIRAFRSALRVPRTICGLHNYSDVNRFRRDGTRALIRALGCRDYWLTETGGVFRFGGFWTRATERAGACLSAAACQLKATEFMFAEAKKIKRIKRIYVHTWYSGARQRFDAGLVRGINSDWLGHPRPAYYVVRDHVWAGPEVTVP